MNDESIPAPITPIPPIPTRYPRPFSYWLKKLLVCNPFYLASAALLLYGMYRVSIDPNFLLTEVKQLVFNFSSLQLYELVLVLTAVLLARRRIWYDSTLLVVLENLFILVPFILVSQAALIQQKIVWPLCVAAAIVAVARTGSLRKYVSELWPASRLFIVGALVLVVNSALPVVFRHLQESKVGVNIEGPASYTYLWAWLLILPVLCALANLLPKPVNDDHPLTQRRWFPHALFTFWIIGTGAHLYCLGYVYELRLYSYMIAPALWVLSWTIHRKLPDFVAEPATALRYSTLTLPLLAALVAIDEVSSHVFVALMVINATIYAFIALYGRQNRFALHLAMISLAAAVAAVPVDWIMPWFAGFDRSRLIVMSATAYLLLAAALSRNPKVGIVGVFAAAATGCALRTGDDTLHWATQAGIVFLLLHSLRWRDDEHTGANIVRILSCAAWVIHSFIWIRNDAAFLHPLSIGAIVLAVCMLRWFIRLNWSPVVVPVTALLVMLCSPVNFLCGKLETTPAGVIAMISSFALFGVGTIVALTKHRWHRNGQPRQEGEM